MLKFIQILCISSHVPFIIEQKAFFFYYPHLSYFYHTIQVIQFFNYINNMSKIFRYFFKVF